MFNNLIAWYLLENEIHCGGAFGLFLASLTFWRKFLRRWTPIWMSKIISPLRDSNLIGFCDADIPLLWYILLIPARTWLILASLETRKGNSIFCNNLNVNLAPRSREKPSVIMSNIFVIEQLWHNVCRAKEPTKVTTYKTYKSTVQRYWHP